MGVVVGDAVCVTVGARVRVEEAEVDAEAIRIGVSDDDLQADSRMANMKNTPLQSG